MKLQGKAKELFEEYVLTLPDTKGQSDSLKILIGCMWVYFYDLPESMQWGIIQDWADSLEYDVGVTGLEVNEFIADISMLKQAEDPFNQLWESDLFKTRQKARTAAIEKLNEIINET